MKTPRLPGANDPEKLARFCHGHGLPNFEDELEEVTELVFARVEPSTATIVHVRVHDDSLIVDLSDGRKVSAPLSSHPRLRYGTEAERANCRQIGNGVEGLLLGKGRGRAKHLWRGGCKVGVRENVKAFHLT
jgi:hypothetical protein